MHRIVRGLDRTESPSCRVRRPPRSRERGSERSSGRSRSSMPRRPRGTTASRRPCWNRCSPTGFATAPCTTTWGMRTSGRASTAGRSRRTARPSRTARAIRISRRTCGRRSRSPRAACPSRRRRGGGTCCSGAAGCRSPRRPTRRSRRSCWRPWRRARPCFSAGRACTGSARPSSSIAAVLSLDAGLAYADVAWSRHGVVTSETIARKGIGKDYEPAFDQPLKDGAEFTVLSENGDWIFGHFEGIGDGWLRREHTVL